MPNQDIIKTALGVLVKPLPVRPEVLNSEQKDKLDIISSDYVIADDKKKKEILKSAIEQLGADNQVKAYLMNYAQSTEALASAVCQIIDGKLKFDNDYIANYTKTNYSQSVIRDKLISIYQAAMDEKKENISYED